MIDPVTQSAIHKFLHRLESLHRFERAVLFGSQARGEMTEHSFDVLIKTGISVQSVPLSEKQWRREEYFSNPWLLEAIAKDGVEVR